MKVTDIIQNYMPSCVSMFMYPMFMLFFKIGVWLRGLGAWLPTCLPMCLCLCILCVCQVSKSESGSTGLERGSLHAFLGVYVYVSYVYVNYQNRSLAPRAWSVAPYMPSYVSMLM